MANEGMKISQLSEATEVLDSDVLAGVGGGVTRKFTFATIASYISTKLTALFDAKQNKITANGVLQGDGDGGVTAKTVDSTPTASSTNLVTSGGVKSALDNTMPISYNTTGFSGTVIGDATTWYAAMANSSMAVARYNSTTANIPVANTGGIIFAFKSSNNYGAQFTLSDAGMHYRKLSSGTWGSWTKII